MGRPHCRLHHHHHCLGWDWLTGCIKYCTKGLTCWATQWIKMLSDWERHIWFSKTKWKDKTSYITEQAQVIWDYIFIYLFIAKLFSLLAMTRVNSGGGTEQVKWYPFSKKNSAHDIGQHENRWCKSGGGLPDETRVCVVGGRRGAVWGRPHACWLRGIPSIHVAIGWYVMVVVVMVVVHYRRACQWKHRSNTVRTNSIIISIVVDLFIGN